MGDGDRLYKKYKGFKVLRGDESNPTFGILVDDASRTLHICLPADENTDWDVPVDVRPVLVVHSETTPATDYISLRHDATDGILAVFGGNFTLALGSAGKATLTSTAFSPVTTDDLTLGTSALNWGDLFLDSGGVINFNSGDVVITHSANLLTITSGGLTVGEDGAGAGDVTFYPDGTGSKVWLDTNGDTNGAFYFGANDYGIDVGFYGQTISESMLWDASANALVFTAGGITLGTGSKLVVPVKASGSTTRGDLWLDTTDGYLHFYDTVERIVTTTAA